MNFIYLLRLWHLGHFFNPKNPDGHKIKLVDLRHLKLSDRVVQDAIASFQEMGKPVLDKLRGGHLLREGILDDFTKSLFAAQRCGHPDYQLNTKIGSGSWPEPCQKAGVTYSVNKNGMPSKFTTTWDEQILKPVVEDYGNVGERLIPHTGTGQANIRISFRSFVGSTIGLAYFNNGSCSDSVTCELSTSFAPNEATEADLLKHEMGHCNGLGHTNGGTMNPYIINRDSYYKWSPSDPSWNTLVRYFGGEPIKPVPPPTPETKLVLISTISGIDKIEVDMMKDELRTYLNNKQTDTYALMNNRII